MNNQASLFFCPTHAQGPSERKGVTFFFFFFEFSGFWFPGTRFNRHLLFYFLSSFSFFFPLFFFLVTLEIGHRQHHQIQVIHIITVIQLLILIAIILIHVHQFDDLNLLRSKDLIISIIIRGKQGLKKK